MLIDNPFTTLVMLRQSTSPNGLTTLSRNMLVQCGDNGQVTINLLNGVVSQGSATENLISFTGYRYGLASTSTMAVWSFYTSSSWTAGSSNIDPLQINIPLISYSGIGYDTLQCVTYSTGFSESMTVVTFLMVMRVYDSSCCGALYASYVLAD